jgi:hypothetical protein
MLAANAGHQARWIKKTRKKNAPAQVLDIVVTAKKN